MKNNSNLEFRKIKSLKFLYEVNENGTILPIYTISIIQCV